MKDEVAGSRYAVSDNGWIDQELFHYLMTDHFLAHAVASRPLLLLLDGHSSHFKPETIQFTYVGSQCGSVQLLLQSSTFVVFSRKHGSRLSLQKISLVGFEKQECIRTILSEYQL